MLLPGDVCRIGVQFTPVAVGQRAATLGFGANNTGVQNPPVALTGTGVAPSTGSVHLLDSPVRAYDSRDDVAGKLRRPWAALAR